MIKVWLVWWIDHSYQETLFAIATTEALAKECVKNQTLDDELCNFTLEEFELYG